LALPNIENSRGEYQPIVSLERSFFMGNYVWSGIGVVLSLVSFAVGVLDDNQTKPSSTAADVQIPKEAVAVLRPIPGEKAEGVIQLMQEKDGVRLKGTVRGLTPGEHGFHIHEFGDLRGTDGKAAGDHYNPEGKKHGGPDHPERHAGDLGNIKANDQGVAEVDILAKDLKLHFVVGRSIVVHADADDLESQPAGDAGERIALGVIGFANSSQSNRTASTEKE
jgi:superoxide dismutase, Cu-Zn family